MRLSPFFRLLKKIMLIEALVIYAFKVGDRVYGPIIFIFRVVITVVLIEIYFSEGFDKFFLCVRNIPKQFIAELENSEAVPISISFVIDFNMRIKPLSRFFLRIFHLLKLLKNIGIDSLSETLGKSRPGIDFDRRDLDDGQQDDQQAAPV